MSEPATAPRPGAPPRAPSRRIETRYPDLAAMLVARSSDRDHGVALYDRRGQSAELRSYSDIARRAAGWRAWMAAEGARPGDAVCLCLPTSHEMIEAFFGAVLLGAPPFILAQPRALGGEAVFRRRMGLLWEALRPRIVLTTRWIADLLTAEGSPPGLAPALRVDPTIEATAGFDPGLARGLDPEGIAYLQLTSGSTALPKAARISHRAVVSNLAASTREAEVKEHEPALSWLPLNHDMGLVGSLLAALYMDAPFHLLRAETFLARPATWLDLISRHRIGLSHSPTFGLRICVERVAPEEVARLDLSAWRCCVVGAEPVRESVVTRFQAHLAAARLPAATLFPCYGMAESVLATTFSRWDEPPRFESFAAADLLVSRTARRLADLGRPLDGIEIELRDAGARRVEDGTEGEIWMRGASLFSGYTDPEATARAFDHEGWFRTGDLGVRRGGKLFVSGRIKDLIILGGVNLAPEELEWAAMEAVNHADGRAGAFASESDDQEGAVLVAEVPPELEGGDLAGLARRIRDQVARDFVPLADLLLVRRGVLPLTTSGKVRRSTLRELYEAGEIAALHRLRGD